MERIRTSTNTATDPQGAGLYVAGPNAAGYFTDGTPAAGDGTIPGALWFNQVQEELAQAIVHDTAIVSALDVTLDNQLATAIGALKTLRSHATDTGSLTTTHLRALIASQTSRADGAAAACIASLTGRASGALSATLAAAAAVASGTNSLVAAALDSDATGTRTAVIASNNSDATTGTDAACLAATQSLASGVSSAVVASDTSTASGISAAVVASDTATASGDKSLVGASNSSTASGAESAVLASESSQATQVNSAALANGGSAGDLTTVQKPRSLIATSIGARIATAVAAGHATLLSSQWCELADDFVIAAGYGPEAESASDGTDWTYNGTNQHLTFKIDTTIGRGYFDDVADFAAADYAEFFENAQPGEIPVGSLVARAGRKVRLAQPGDRICGVVSATPTIAGNSSGLHWAGKFATDEWGRTPIDMVPLVRWPAITRPSAARVAAETAAEDARLAFVAAVDAALCAGQITEDQRKHCEALAAELSDAWKALLPWRLPRHKNPRRVPENEGQWQHYERAQAACNATDVTMRAEVEARVASALAAVKAAEAQWLADRQAAKALAQDVEEVRAGYDGRIDRAPSPVPADAEHRVQSFRRLADGYDARRDFTPRRDRPDEWTCVGLVGQVRVRIDASVSVDDLIATGPDGIGTKAKKEPKGRPVECMEIVSPFDAARGYGVALCLVG